VADEDGGIAVSTGATVEGYNFHDDSSLPAEIFIHRRLDFTKHDDRPAFVWHCGARCILGSDLSQVKRDAGRIRLDEQP
jgi:hypothetical protein